MAPPATAAKASQGSSPGNWGEALSRPSRATAEFNKMNTAESAAAVRISAQWR